MEEKIKRITIFRWSYLSSIPS